MPVTRSTTASRGNPNKPATNKANTNGAAPSWDSLMAKNKGQMATARKAAQENASFAPPDIPDGDYSLRLTSCKCAARAVWKDGKKTDAFEPVVNFNFVIADGEYKGTVVRQQKRLGNEYESKDVWGYWGALGYNLDDLKPDGSEFPEICKELCEQRPLLRCNIKNKFSGENEKTGKPYHNQYVYIREVLEESAEPGDEEEEPGDDDQADDVEEGDELEAVEEAPPARRSSPPARRQSTTRRVGGKPKPKARSRR